MKYLNTYHLFESVEDRRSREINLIEDHKQDIHELFYDLTDVGYSIYPSYNVIPDFMRKSDKDNIATFRVRITKTNHIDYPGPDKPFIFSDIINDVDRFILYLNHIKADSVQCQIVFANYDDDKIFIRQYGGRKHSWKDLKQKIKEYLDTPAVVVALQINYTINID